MRLRPLCFRGVLVGVSIVVENTVAKALRKEKGYFAYTSQSQPIIKGGWGRNSRQEPGRGTEAEAMEEAAY